MFVLRHCCHVFVLRCCVTCLSCVVVSCVCLASLLSRVCLALLCHVFVLRCCVTCLSCVIVVTCLSCVVVSRVCLALLCHCLSCVVVSRVCLASLLSRVCLALLCHVFVLRHCCHVFVLRCCVTCLSCVVVSLFVLRRCVTCLSCVIVVTCLSCVVVSLFVLRCCVTCLSCVIVVTCLSCVVVSRVCLASLCHVFVLRRCVTCLSCVIVSPVCLASLCHMFVLRRCVTCLSCVVVSRVCLASLCHVFVLRRCVTCLSCVIVSHVCLASLCHVFVLRRCVTCLSCVVVSRVCLENLDLVVVSRVCLGSLCHVASLQLREVALDYNDCRNSSRVRHQIKSSIYLRWRSFSGRVQLTDTCSKLKPLATWTVHPSANRFKHCCEAVCVGSASRFNSCDICFNYERSQPLRNQGCVGLASDALSWQPMWNAVQSTLLSLSRSCGEAMPTYKPGESVSFCCGSDSNGDGRDPLLHRKDHDTFTRESASRWQQRLCRKLQLEQTFGWLPAVPPSNLSFVHNDSEMAEISGLRCRTSPNRTLNFYAMDLSRSYMFLEKLGIRTFPNQNPVAVIFDKKVGFALTKLDVDL